MNSDLVFHKKDDFGNLVPYSVDTTHIGKCIYTKAVGSTHPEDVTHNYKNPEGDAEAPIPASSGGLTRSASLGRPNPVSLSPPGGHVRYLQGAQKT